MAGDTITSLIERIGSFVLATLIFSIPILLGVSVGFHWYPGITIMLGLGTVFEFALFLIFLHSVVVEGE